MHTSSGTFLAMSTNLAESIRRWNMTADTYIHYSTRSFPRSFKSVKVTKAMEQIFMSTT